jgi:uncharacterized membrane protein
MAAFPFLRKQEPFTLDEKQKIVAAIQAAEKKTSGEIRIYIEDRCRFVDPLDRAAELFWSLKMDHTVQQNAVLIYVALKDHQYALYADAGIHRKLGQAFWETEVKQMQRHFISNHLAEAIAEVISDVGTALQEHFPYQNDLEKNELPDDIIFGR